MKRITYWFLATLSVVVLLFGYDGSSTSTTASPPAAIATDGTSGTGSTGSTGSTTPTGTGTGKKVTGTVAPTQWGPVQVQLKVTGGKITSVAVLQYPSGNPKDTEINNYALPILTRETTDAQSANIDMVSGATVTSTGYLQSLQSAIDQAGL